MTKEIQDFERVKISGNSQIVYEVTKAQTEPDARYPYANYGAWPWAIWGADNNYPQNIIDENMADPTSAGCMRFKINAHYGKGFYFYKSSVDPQDTEIKKPIATHDLPPDIQQFLWANDIENFQQGIIKDFEWFNMYHPQYILSRTGKVVNIIRQRTKDVRAHKRDPQSGKIPTYFLSAYWPLPINGFWAEVPAFDKYNIDPEKCPNGIYRHYLSSVDRDYYIIPEWQSNLRFIEISKRIPKWMLSNINNSANIKYHVQIPQSYFEALHPRDRYKDDQEWKKAMNDEYNTLTKNLDLMLTGEENVSKVFYSRIALDENMKPYPGWSIDPIKNELKDDAWIAAYQTATGSICNAHGVPITLSGTIVPNDRRAGSGSDVREQFNMYMQTATVQPRQTTTEWFEVVKKINGWPKDLYMGYRDIIFQSIDQNPTGFQVQHEPNPTSVNKGDGTA